MVHPDVVRYEQAVFSSLKIKQLKIEIEREKHILNSLLTVNEAKYHASGFNYDAVVKCLNNLKNRNNIELKKADYVGSQLEHKDVSINLHSPINKLDVKSFINILKG